MRGTEVTEGQLRAADQFMRDVVMKNSRPEMDQQVAVSYGEFLRVVAWYGAMRYIAGRDGVGGTLENPGVFDIVDRKESR